MINSIQTKSSALEVHKRLVSLISEESEILEKNNLKGKEKDRHEDILSFLIELQCISARNLHYEDY